MVYSDEFGIHPIPPPTSPSYLPLFLFENTEGCMCIASLTLPRISKVAWAAPAAPPPFPKSSAGGHALVCAHLLWVCAVSHFIACI